MAKKRNRRKKADDSKDFLSKDLLAKDLLPKDLLSRDPLSKHLWIADRYSLKGPAGERAWENRRGGVPSSSRYLELADIALGTKKPVRSKKPDHLHTAHDTHKTEPYSSK
jgi:hypothetical protein